METPLRFSRFGTLLEYVLLPPACCVCGLRALGRGLDLCATCQDSLPASASMPLADPGAQLRRYFDRMLIPYVYRYPIDEFVRALKFRGELRHARLLGMLIAAAHVRSGAPTPAALVPLPLHLSRLRHRGFNQAEAIARHAGAALGIKVLTTLLARGRATQEQSRLGSGQRQLNVLGAFVLRCALPADTRIALIDDVVTTGSTVREAAVCLREGGVRQLELWAAAQVPIGRSFRTAESSAAGQVP